MERSINKIDYFDYNATSPLALTVSKWLSSGDVPFANPASVYRSGRYSKKIITEATSFVKESFGLLGHELFFHSGATEGITTSILGFAASCKKKDKKIDFFFSNCDHPAVSSLAPILQNDGSSIHQYNVERYGDVDLDELVRRVQKSTSDKILVNFTYVNNESGVVWPLALAKELKRLTGCYIHVDAVQAPGKIKEWNRLLPEIDAYTFSAHKFGAIKGIGFTFVRKDFPFQPLLIGGGQQNGMRSGTENPMGVHSVKLALEELKNDFNFEEMNSATRYIEAELKRELGTNIVIASDGSKNRNGNTIFMILKNKKMDTLLAALDINGIEVGTGSACSSGNRQPSKVLLAYGFSEEEAKSAIRLSFSPQFRMEQAKKSAEKLLKLIKSLS